MPRKPEDNLKLGDLVFAKMKGFPYWPARVRTCTNTHGFSCAVGMVCAILVNVPSGLQVRDWIQEAGPGLLLWHSPDVCQLFVLCSLTSFCPLRQTNHEPCCFPCRGHLPPSNIVPYSGNKLKYGGGTFFKGFAEGMWEIQNTPGVGSKLKVSWRRS